MHNGNRTILYSRKCWIEGELTEASIFIAGNLIERIVRARVDDPLLEDHGDHIIMPGVIDAHVHVNEPGRTEWEGFDTATQAAAAGGVTTIIDMPLNSSPVTVTPEALHQKIAASQDQLHVNCGFYGGLIPGNENEMEALIHEGVFGIKAFLTHSGIDEFPNAGKKELDAVMPILADHQIPLLVHCEIADNEHLQQLKEDPTSYQAYLKSRPDAWEVKAIELMISLCRQYNCPVHIVHVSSAQSLSLIREARMQGLPLTTETCPHYILFHAEDIPDGSTVYKCAPPIRSRKNNEALQKAFIDGALDFLTTDHSPAPPDMKEVGSGNLLKAWGGISGLQFLLPAGWTALKNIIRLETFIPLVTEHPSRFLKLDHKKGFIKTGYDADLVVWDPGEILTVKKEMLLYKHKISPYVSCLLAGKVRKTLVNGREVYNGEEIIHKNMGQCLLRK